MNLKSDKDKYLNIHTLIRNDVLLERVNHFILKHSRKPRILEYGCGMGGTINVLSKQWSDYLAVDTNSEIIYFLRKNNTHENINYVSLSDPSSIISKFDIIICFSVMEHVDDDRSLVRYFQHLLVSGGLFIGQVPAHRKLFSIIDQYYGHFRRYDFEDLKKLIESHEMRLENVLSQGVRILMPYEVWKFNSKYKSKKFDREAQNKMSGSSEFTLLAKLILLMKCPLYPFAKRIYRRFSGRFLDAGVEFLFVAKKI